MQVSIEGKNILLFALWRSIEYTGREITIHFFIIAFSTGAPEWSEKFLRQMG